MILYRISLAKYSKSLKASGAANRWNRKDEFVLYTTGSISLAVLEMLAHRSNILPENIYKVLKIAIADDASIKEINIKNLPRQWRSVASYSLLQEVGSAWYQNRESLILKTPSVLVPEESNFMINTQHESFKQKVRLLSATDFVWDERLL